MADQEVRAQTLVRDAQARVAQESARRRDAKPKNTADGVKQGLMSLVGGIGAGGAALVLGPIAGGQAAPKGKKIQGVLKGVVGGLAIGLAAPVAGAAAGVGKVVEGTKAKGKRVEYTHVTRAHGTSPEEIERNLQEDRAAYLTERTELFQGMILDDEDVPGSSGAGQSGEPRKRAPAPGGLPEPVNTEFYDVLKLQPSATSAEIRKAYHRRSLETHPDRTGASGEEFKAVSDAYQVLSDPEKRKNYHLHGKTDSLSEDAISPDVLFSLMLMPKGFKHIIGDAAMSFILAQEAEQSEGGEDAKMLLAGQLATFHEQRVAELSEFLARRVEPYVEGKTDEFASFAEREAVLLAKEPLGTDVLRTVGYAYSSKAKLILGAQSSVPLRGFFAELADTGGMLKKQLNAAMSLNAMTVADAVNEAEDDVDQAEHRRAVTGLSAVFMMSMVDVQNVLREVVEKVCSQEGVRADVLHKRAEAINILGAIFSAVEYHVEKSPASSPVVPTV